MFAPLTPREATPDAPPQFSLSTLLLSMVLAAAFLAGVTQWSHPVLALTSLGALGWAIVRVVRRQSAGYLFAFLLLSFPACMISFPFRPNEGALAAQCMNNLKQISLALHNYEVHHKQLPPPYIADAQGRPMHSWRVLLLPYLEQQPLYNAYKFDEPWDGPNNRKLHDIILQVYCCPSENADRGPSTMTSYLAVVGPGTAWDPAGPTRLLFSGPGSIADGNSNTMLVVESCETGIHWMEPRDLQVAQMKPAVNAQHGQGICSKHRGRAHVASADGSVHALPETMAAETIRALLTTRGGEPVKWDE